MELKFGIHEIAMNMAFSTLKEIDINKESSHIVKLFESCSKGSRDECAWRYYIMV